MSLIIKIGKKKKGGKLLEPFYFVKNDLTLPCLFLSKLAKEQKGGGGLKKYFSPILI